MAAITHYHKPDVLKQNIYFLTVLEARKMNGFHWA